MPLLQIILPPDLYLHELCLAATPLPGGGSSQPLRWWQQDHADEDDNDNGDDE